MTKVDKLAQAMHEITPEMVDQAIAWGEIYTSMMFGFGIVGLVGCLYGIRWFVKREGDFEAIGLFCLAGMAFFILSMIGLFGVVKVHVAPYAFALADLL